MAQRDEILQHITGKLRYPTPAGSNIEPTQAIGAELGASPGERYLGLFLVQDQGGVPKSLGLVVPATPGPLDQRTLQLQYGAQLAPTPLADIPDSHIPSIHEFTQKMATRPDESGVPFTGEDDGIIVIFGAAQKSPAQLGGRRKGESFPRATAYNVLTNARLHLEEGPLAHTVDELRRRIFRAGTQPTFLISKLIA